MTRRASVAASDRLHNTGRQPVFRGTDFGDAKAINMSKAGAVIAASGKRENPDKTACNKTMSHKRAEFDQGQMDH